MAYSEIEISQEVGGLPAELGIQGESPFRLELALFRVREMDFRSESTNHLREGDIETHVVVHSDSVSHTNRDSTPPRKVRDFASHRAWQPHTPLRRQPSPPESFPGRQSPHGLNELAGPRVAGISLS